MTQTAAPKPIGTLAIHSVGEVRVQLADIARWAEIGDFARATQVERNLWEGVLESVAGANAQAGWIAAEALKSRDIPFPREALS